MQKAYGSHDIASVLDLRLVCKDWRDGCLQYAGSAHCNLRQSTQLSQACKTVPALRGLSIESYTPNVDFGPLSGFCQLSSLSLFPSNKHCEQHSLDLDVLPPSMKSLTILSFRVVLSPYTYMQLAGLTELYLAWMKSQNTTAEVLDLVKQLPKLKVSFVSLAGRLYRLKG